MLQGKNILIGVTAGIASYKINLLVRSLVQHNAHVKCIMTPSAKDFISPLTLATLSQNPVAVEFWNSKNGEWENHVKLAEWADLFVIAPLTLNTLSKMSHGGCDNLLLATYFSAKCPVVVCPAMDLDMYAHPVTKQNLALLEKHDVKVIPAEEGFLASGLEGKGRMAEPSTIFDYIATHFYCTKQLEGQKILITAGPTYEAIDPVRFIGNHSSGKMGYSLAKSALNQGAEVVLISGPSQQILDHEKLTIVKVKTALEMLAAVQEHFASVDLGIFAAAVSDYRPAETKAQKIKKSQEKMELHLIKNPDILAWAGKNKTVNQLLCGFALETQNGEKHAREKLTRKNLDFIVMNTLEDEGAGFGHDTNKVLLLDKNNNSKKVELSNKNKIANEIISYIYSNQ